MGDLRDKTIKGLFWGGLDIFSSKGLSFLFNLLIARQLSPRDYGVIAILAVMMAICQCFVDSGFGAALVRKCKCSETDFSTIFYFNIFAALLFYIILYAVAPFIASFYEQPVFVDLTKIYSLVLIINALAIVQNSKLTIEVNFKVFAKISIISAIISGSAALFMAYKGFGIWSLVVQALTSATVRSLLLWVFSRWTPKAIFSWNSLNEHFSFGSRLLGSSLINTIYNNIYTLVIGKMYAPESLGAYNKGESLIKFPSETVTTIIGQVSYPILSSIKDDRSRSIDAYRQLVRMASFIIFPMVIGMAAIADPFIRICLTDKWEMAIPVMQVLCFSLLWVPITNLDLTMLKAAGRSDYFLRITIITKSISIIILIATVSMGLIIMCIGQVLATIIHLIIIAYYTKKAFNYGIVEKILDTGMNFCAALLMGGLVLLTVNFMPNSFGKLCTGIIIGLLSYIVIAILFKIKEFNVFTDIIHNKIIK